ncbi:MAG: bacterial translation initiation factor 3 (bIF-3) [Dehalococcoidia bacterium]|nr:bacterial translation initiation factor 3 (bIF-3) [Dehalococcoidia bacterium]
MQPIAREYRLNQQIRVREVRLIGANGEQLGVVPIAQALQLATDQELDLVEVAPTATPPVCRLLDFGKFRYEQAKKDRESRKGQKSQELREVRMRPRTEEHDIDVKVRLIHKFLAEGQKVKIAVFFRGREITHPELGAVLLRKVAEYFTEEAKLEKSPAMEGRSMTMILAPGPVKRPSAEPVKERASAKA